MGGPTQERVHALLRELGSQTFHTHTAGHHISELGGRQSTYTGRIPRLNPAVLADIAQIQWRLDRLARRAPPHEPWRAPGSDRLNGQTFDTWLRSTAATPQGRGFFQSVNEAVFSAGPEDLSAPWADFYIGAAGGVDALINTTGGAQQDRIVGGAQQIALALANDLGDRVVLDSPVTDVQWSDNGARVRSVSATVRAGHVVIAVPPPWPRGSASPPACPATATSWSSACLGAG